MQASLLASLSGPSMTEETRADVARLKKEAERYEQEKGDIKKEAERLHHEAAHDSSINDRCDHSSLFLQLSVVFCSVSILARSHKLWYVGILLGAVGAVIGVTAFLI